MKAPLGLRDWGADEFIAAGRAAFGLVQQADLARDLEAWFGQSFGRPAFALNSGRNAVRLALECLRLLAPDRDEVVLPALVCPALVSAVQNCGLRAVFADIGADLNTPVEAVSRCLSARTLAVVMVHAYGHPADVQGLARLCAAQGVALIDDAAQRVDPPSRLGLAGDFGVFSFAQSKSVVTGIDGSGGVLLVNEPRHRAALEERVAALTVASGRRLAWLEFALTPGYPRLAYYVARWRRRRQHGAPGPARIGALDAAIASAQLASLERRSARRVLQLGWYREALSAAGITVPQMTKAGPVDYLARLMVRLPADARGECRRALSAVGASSRLPYVLPEAVTPDSHPAAVAASRELLELPLPPRLGRADVDEIVGALVAAVGAARAVPSGADTVDMHSNSGRQACNITGR